ncbi:DUF1376 domain-containing protein [Mameliella alba]|uniref:DUF1376 domain-containing protein n=1 Tax=Mameliella alba TaxID=561184 RepID=UPI00143170A6|nr:DUF1376 domain-containing protein [Mameliella alba]
MTDNFPWGKFHTSDWLTETGDLTPAERGVLITIVCLEMEAGGPLQDINTRLARRCALQAGGFAKIKTALVEMDLLVQSVGMLSSRFGSKMLKQRQDDSAKRQSGARKTNAAKAKKNKKNQYSNERSASRSAQFIQKPESEISPLTPQGEKPCGPNGLSENVKMMAKQEVKKRA